jgi:hypothetical protein
VFLLVVLAIAALWVRGLYARDHVTTQIAGHKLVIAIFPQHVYVIAVPRVGARRDAPGHRLCAAYPSRPRYWECSIASGRRSPRVLACRSGCR